MQISLAILNTLGKLEDRHGRELYQVCGDEGEDDKEGGLEEMDELLLMGTSRDKDINVEQHPAKSIGGSAATQSTQAIHEDSETGSEPESSPLQPTSDLPVEGKRNEIAKNIASGTAVTGDGIEIHHPSSGNRNDTGQEAPPSSNILACPICSLENELGSATCAACSHVLKPARMPNHWRCKSDQCKASKYINTGDVGRCGICGAQKPAAETKPMGVTGSDVLRWD